MARGRRLHYVDSNYNYTSDITRVRRFGLGTTAPTDAQRTIGYFQGVPTNSADGTEFNFSFFNYIRPSSPALATDYRNIYAISQTAGGVGSQFRDIYNTYFYALNNGNNIVRNIYAVYGNASANGVGSTTTAVHGGFFYGNASKTCTNVYGSYSYAYAQINATVTNLYASRLLAYNYTGSTVTRHYGSYINLRVQQPNTVSTSGYGIYVSGTAIAPAVFTNYYGLYIATPPITTSGRYCIYSGGDVKSYHRGALGIGVGSTNVGTHMLRVVGTAGLSTGTTWTVFSDARLKDIVSTYKKGLAEICKLKPKVYKYKEDNKYNLDSNLRSGLIAQDVQHIFPDAIDKDNDGYLQLNVDPINYALINAIRELNEKVVLLEGKINDSKI